jgi:DNA polymerase IV
VRIIFHIDVNSAYLSWTAVEQLKNGAKVDIRTIPAIIGGDQKSRHGIVLAKSIPAKKYGIRTGEPVANAFRKCPNLKSYPPDHQMYREYSRRLMDFLRTYTTHIEQVSVDECYMDFTEIADRFTSPVEGANEIKDEVYKRFGFTVNVGISSRKVLAKMASDFEKPNKVHTLFPEEVPVKMWPLPIGELFMAGRSSVETMKKLEIYTIGDLANTDPAILELHLKSHGRKLWEFANGLDDSEVESVRAEAKGVGNSTTLPKDLTTEEEALPVLKDLAASVGCIVFLLVMFGGNILAGFFTTDVAVIQKGYAYLKGFALETIVTAILFSMVGYFNGNNKTVWVMTQGLIQTLLVRLPFAYVMSIQPNASLTKIGLAAPVSTMVGIVLNVGFYIYLDRAEKKSNAL